MLKYGVQYNNGIKYNNRGNDGCVSFLRSMKPGIEAPWPTCHTARASGERPGHQYSKQSVWNEL